MAKKSNKTEHVLNLITKNELKENNNPTANTDIKPNQKIEPSQSLYLINLTEKLAREMVSQVMEKMNVCSCPICKNDVLALALNSLKQKYVTTDAGKQYLLLEVYKKQSETDVIAALTKACVRVKVSPRHEIK